MTSIQTGTENCFPLDALRLHLADHGDNKGWDQERTVPQSRLAGTSGVLHLPLQDGWGCLMR